MNWTKQRAEQINQLEALLQIIMGLNNGSGFLQKTEEAIKLATSLKKADLSNCAKCFPDFLKAICIEERLKERAESK